MSWLDFIFILQLIWEIKVWVFIDNTKLSMWPQTFERQCYFWTSHQVQAEVHERVSTGDLVLQSVQPLSDLLSAEKKGNVLKLHFSLLRCRN